MGLFAYTLAGGGFILIGAWESIISSVQTQKPTTPTAKTTQTTKPSSSSVTSVAVFLFSLIFISNSLISLFYALNSKDRTGLVIQLEVISIASLFLLYSVLGLINHFTNWVLFPSPILNLLCLFGFIEEFLMFYLQRKDPSGIENRYFDLILVPIGVCILSTILELQNPKSRYSRLSRGIGLVSQGLWILQMGFSFYSDAITHGCFLNEKSRGNFTIKCKGHPEYHRARAIATLQFNCHLAFIVIVVTAVFSILCKTTGIDGGMLQYKPIGEETHEMQSLDGESRFTLDSDDDLEEDRIREERNAGAHKTLAVVTEQGVNGYGVH